MCVCVCLCVSVCLCVCVCVLASGFAGRRACLVALLLLHHDGGGVLLGAKPSAPLDAQLLVQLGGCRLPGDVGRCGEMWGDMVSWVQLGGRRLPRHRHTHAAGPTVRAADPQAAVPASAPTAAPLAPA